MASTIPLLDRYLRHRRLFEVGLCLLIVAVEAVTNSLTTAMDLRRSHLTYASWEPWVWEWSSGLVVLALIPAVLAVERRWPLRLARWRLGLAIHLLATLPFSVAHVGAMIALRRLAYAAAGSHYDAGDLLPRLLYEYLKDCRTYATILGLVYVYRFFLLRLQGEASLLAPAEGAPPAPEERPERFLVRKLGKEFLVAAADIEWLEAAGNYVNLHVRGRHYPLRSTMTALEPRLDPRRFQRVHRSYIVNLDHLAEIEPLDTGDARLRLKDGSQVPCSRRYRELLRSRSG